MDKLKIMVLGYSGSGKTYLQASWLQLAYETGEQGISLQSLNFNEETSILKIFSGVSGQNSNTQIPTTMKIQFSEMVLKKGVDDLFQIDIADIEGQALEPGRNVEVSKLILSQIPSYDSLFLVIDYPEDKATLQRVKQELSQLLNFAGKALKENPKIPLTLVINKIDALPKAKQIKTNSESEISQLEEDLIRQNPNNRFQVIKLKKQQQGTIINKYVKPIVDDNLICELCGQFSKFVRNTKSSQIPAKVFVASSLGFGNNNNTNLQSYVSTDNIYQPYGGVAALLWTIYARLTMQTTGGSSPNINIENGLSVTELIEDLRSDLQELYMTGQAYFDPDGNSRDNIWSLGNAVALRAGID